MQIFNQWNIRQAILCTALCGGALLPCIAVRPAAVEAQSDYMTEVQGFSIYPGGNGTAILDSVNPNLAGSVVIPDTFVYTTISNNEKVSTTLRITYINKYAFDGCVNLEQVQLPAGVNRIGNGAFSNCPKLKAIILPDNSKGITWGSNVFSGSDQVRIYGNYNETPQWLDSYSSLFAGKLASEGTWRQSSNGKWWFCYDDQTWPKDQWAKIDGFWYHFDQNGYRETGWIKIKDDWYYLNLDGTMAQSTWISGNYVDQSGRFIRNKWVQKGSKWWYRFGDGTYPRNTWAVIDGKRYLFDASGWMLVGWVQLGDGWYHLSSNGALDTNKWVGTCYVNDMGIWTQDTWEKTDGNWRYRYADGTIAKDGLVQIDGKSYYFDADGRMKTGWIHLDDGWHYFRSSGEMAKDTTIQGYVIDENGLWVQ